MDVKNLDYKPKEVKIYLGFEEVMVKSYISSKDKSDIIKAVSQEALQDIIVDQVKLDALFNAYIILNYTDVEIPHEKLNPSDLMEIYDYFEYHDYMSSIINEIPKNEYEALVVYLKNTIDDFNRVKTSTKGAIESLVSSVPAAMEEIKRIIDEMDIDSLSTLKGIYSQFES